MLEQKNGHAERITILSFLVDFRCRAGKRSRNCQSRINNTERLRNIAKMRKVTTDRRNMITSAESTISATVLTTDPGRIWRERSFAVSIAEHKIDVPSKLLMTSPAQIAAIRECPVRRAKSSPATSKSAKSTVVKSVSVRMGGPSDASAATARAV